MKCVQLAPDADKALRGGLTARRSDGSVHPLILKAADVERELSKQGTGALARMAKKHEEEVEAARALMRQMWSSMRSSDLKNPAAVRRQLFPHVRPAACNDTARRFGFRAAAAVGTASGANWRGTKLSVRQANLPP